MPLEGDHKYFGEREETYRFTTLDQLVADFWADLAGLGNSLCSMTARLIGAGS